MMQRGKDVFILVATLFLTLCFMSISNSESDATKGGEIKDRVIVARVNGEPVYKDELTPFTEQELKKFKKYGMTRKQSPKVMKHMEKRALEKLIAQELLVQESRNIKVDDIEKKVDEGVKRVKIKYKTEENFKSYLESNNLTEESMRENIRKGIYIEAYLEEKGIRNPVIPEEEIKSYYEETKENYRRDEYIKASHILIKADENASQEEKDAARGKAEKIRTEIIGGKDFAAMAREFSEDGRAANGGDLNYIKRGFMPPEFDSVAFALKKDDVSDVVQTKYGFHIIKVFDKKPAGISPYEEVRSFIEKYLQKELSSKKMASHMEELKSKAKIEVLTD